MMELITRRHMKFTHGAGIKDIAFTCLICFVLLLTSENLKAQAKCTSYEDTLDVLVERIFTAERHDGVRQANFPPELHNVTKAEVRHLNVPDELWICTEALKAFYPDGNLPDLDIEWALYRVKDYHYLVSTTYETDSDGNRRITPPTMGMLFNPQFDIIEFIRM